MFAALPAELGFGAYAAPPQPPVTLAVLPDASGFVKEGVQYRWVRYAQTLAVGLRAYVTTAQPSVQLAVLPNGGGFIETCVQCRWVLCAQAWVGCRVCVCCSGVIQGAGAVEVMRFGFSCSFLCCSAAVGWAWVSTRHRWGQLQHHCAVCNRACKCTGAPVASESVSMFARVA
jgi:hypothetical protein